MKLEVIQKQIPRIQWQNFANSDITDIQQDSRKVQPGSLFVARSGTKTSGISYIEDAVRRGAVAIVAEKKVSIPTNIPCGVASGIEESLAELASLFWSHPSQELFLIGITGTNGKTTTAFLIYHLLKKAGYPVGMIGTLGNFFHHRQEKSQYTTPDALEIQRVLAQMVVEKIQYVVMEVSSHALIQKRTHGLPFQRAIFTNLSRDHLDYHKTMLAYGQAKSILFRDLAKIGKAIINQDDPAHQQMIENCSAETLYYGLQTGALKEYNLSTRGNYWRWQDSPELFCPLPGKYNLYNSLAAMVLGRSIQMSWKQISDALAEVPGVPGRMERVNRETPIPVFVDYAHTPDALENLLRETKALVSQNLILVFGCGGNRDRGKRREMGKVADSLADMIWLTDDNPRDEDPKIIISEIIEGIKNKKYHICHDRKSAIQEAIACAKTGDIVIVAGKGHESGQEVCGKILPFQDREIIQEILGV